MSRRRSPSRSPSRGPSRGPREQRDTDSERSGPPHWWRLAFVLVPALVRQPGLWPTAMVAIGRLARRRWWSSRPFIPAPDESYWRFRMVTVYGDPNAEPLPEDVMEYLRWYRSNARGQV